MDHASLLQSFAINKVGDVVSVDDVARGQACECTCPACGAPLIARHGEIRIWHFAHASGTDCAGGAESALHLAAKTIIARADGMMFPALVARRSVTLPDGRSGSGTASFPSGWIDFSRTTLEVPIGTIKPDVVAESGDMTYLIEVAVTHFVGEEKLHALKSIGLPAIEIDLAMHDRESWGWSTLENFIIHSPHNRRWLVTPPLEELVAEAMRAATKDAQSKAMPPAKPAEMAATSSKSNRTRYWPNGRIVDLIDRPFGVALWSPFDAQFNETIKGWARELGGQWQPRFRNWLFPTQARPYLVERITGCTSVRDAP